jgi:putative DNA primase/helicase
VSTGIEAALGPDLVTKCSLAQISNPESKNLAKLGNAALNLSTELDAVEVGSEIFKMLVSGESIDADRKYRDSVTLQPTCKLWFNANHLPRFKSGTDAEQKRALIIRFGVKVLVRDEQLKESIKAEADGVFLFMFDGLRQLMCDRKFPVPSTKSAETKERFKLQNDHIGSFVAAECALGAELEIEKDDLYKAYDEFGRANSIYYHKDPDHFFKELYERYPGVKALRRRVGTVRDNKVQGIELRNDE